MSVQELGPPPGALRSAALDQVRILGIVAVVAGHVWGDTAVGLIVYPWHVPLFFVLTGYLWRRPRSVRTEVAKRWLTLAVPYLAWLAIISFVLSVELIREGTFQWSALLIGLYGGGLATRPFTTFWFVSVLFFSSVVYRLLEKLPLWLQLAIVGCGLVLAYVDGKALSTSPLAIGLVVPCLAFIMAGRMLHVFRRRITRPGAVGSVLVVISAALVVSSLSARLDLKAGNFGTPVLSVIVGISISLGFILVAEALEPYVNETLRNASISLAAGGLLVVLVHPLVLSLLDTPRHGRTLGFVLALVAPWTLSMLVIRTPLARLLAGVTRRKQAR